MTLAIAFAQNKKLNNEYFTRDMLGASKILEQQLLKGDSSNCAYYAYVLKRLHKDEQAYKFYKISFEKGLISEQVHLLDYLHLASQLDKSDKNLINISTKLEQAGYRSISESLYDILKLSKISNACFNAEADDIACSNNIVSSTRITQENNIENSLLKTFLVDNSCKLIPIKTNQIYSINDNKRHIGPINEQGEWLFVTRSQLKANKAGIYNLEIVYSKKESGKYSDLNNLPFNNSNYSVQHPYFDKQNNILYFSSNMPGGSGGFDIYTSSYNLNSLSWSKPEIIKEISTSADEVFPTLDSKGILYYSTTTINGDGGLDIIAFDLIDKKITKLPAPINSEYDDFLFLQEGLSGLITSNRKGGKGGDDVYNFTIDTTPYKICIELINSDSPLIGINNTPLEISYQNRQLNLLSDDGGKACFSISAIDAFVNPSQSLSINIKKSGFESITQQMHSLILSSENKNITLNQPLKPIKVIMPPVVKIKIGQDLGKLLNLNPIYFDLGKWDVRPDAAIELDKIVKAMQEFPGLIIELGSHTDSRASAKFNQTLSQKRAESSGKYILSKGIDPKRLTWKGYGESKLLNKCKDGVKCSEDDHSKNRRTEFRIVRT